MPVLPGLDRKRHAAFVLWLLRESASRRKSFAGPALRLLMQDFSTIVSHGEKRDLVRSARGHHQIAEIGNKLIGEGFKLNSFAKCKIQSFECVITSTVD